MKFGEVKDQPRGKNNLGDVILLAKPPQFETNDVQQEKEIELIKQVESINTDKIQEQLNQKKTNEITKKEEELKNLKNKTLPTQTQSDQFKAVQPKAAGRNLSDFASKENLLCTLSIRDITVFEQARDPQEIESKSPQPSHRSASQPSDRSASQPPTTRPPQRFFPAPAPGPVQRQASLVHLGALPYPLAAYLGPRESFAASVSSGLAPAAKSHASILISFLSRPDGTAAARV